MTVLVVGVVLLLLQAAGVFLLYVFERKRRTLWEDYARDLYQKHIALLKSLII